MLSCFYVPFNHLTNGLKSKSYTKKILYGQTQTNVSLKLGTWGALNENICTKIYFSTKVAHPRRLYGVKIMTIRVIGYL
jgi:hypothetical protein